MKNRRDFLKTTAVASVGLALQSFQTSDESILNNDFSKVKKPIVLSTWRFGIPANEAAWEILKNKGKALDAVVAGVKIPEGDPKERSVGYGGRPDRDGRVTLDSCIMDEFSNIGAVACLEHIKHPIEVARAVMEKTPHVMLVGDGALQFALEQGYKKENLLVEESEKEWKEWLKDSNYKPIANIENHDTIGMIALDEHGNLSGACTTSGMAYKMHGRVGDSPIIGAGLYVDNEIGAATATGHGEEVIRIAGCHLVVELMRQGKSPQKACEEAVMRIVKLTTNRGKNLKDIQVGFIALNKNGEHGAYCIQGGFNYAKYDETGNHLIDANYFFEVMKKIEIACFNLDAAIIAAKSGADRIELCDDIALGGTTPTAKLVIDTLSKVETTVYVMIRPRGGNFTYSDIEFEEMKYSIEEMKKLGVNGFVFGILNKDNTVNVEQNSELVTLAKPSLCTFHRAFDEVSNHEQALEDVINCGFSTILTSGTFPNVMEGKEVLKQLVIQANNRIAIMPGGGLRSSNISTLDEMVNANWYHSSAITDGSETANQEEIIQLKTKLQS